MPDIFLVLSESLAPLAGQLVVLAHYFTRISSVLLFWIAFVLTRPFEATFAAPLPTGQPIGMAELGTMFSQCSSGVLWGVGCKKLRR